MTRTRWQVCALILALVAFVALAHSVATAVSEQHAARTDTPCQRMSLPQYQRFVQTVHALVRSNPYCAVLRDAFDEAQTTDELRRIGTEAMQRECW